MVVKEMEGEVCFVASSAATTGLINESRTRVVSFGDDSRGLFPSFFRHFLTKTKQGFCVTSMNRNLKVLHRICLGFREGELICWI